MTFFGSLWGDKFLVVKKFFEEGWIFFHFKAGTPYGKIAKIGCEAGGGGVGDSTLHKLNFILILSLPQFSKIV